MRGSVCTMSDVQCMSIVALASEQTDSEALPAMDPQVCGLGLLPIGHIAMGISMTGGS